VGWRVAGLGGSQLAEEVDGFSAPSSASFYGYDYKPAPVGSEELWVGFLFGCACGLRYRSIDISGVGSALALGSLR
jgi:hypothetical protein